jgi:hypothetical protein
MHDPDPVAANSVGRRHGMGLAHPWYQPFVKALRVGAFLLAHVLTAALLVTLLSGFSWLLHSLGNPKLFEQVPVSYVFDAMDLMVLVVFVIFGLVEAVTVFRGKDNGSGGEARVPSPSDGAGNGAAPEEIEAAEPGN